ncbi:hypothetical protein HY463_00095 [Candidatus Peregrinibacteria bacterium]|nr:hypothetical protein [Candidatus Peregrinibacteria bacterium]
MNCRNTMLVGGATAGLMATVISMEYIVEHLTGKEDILPFIGSTQAERDGMVGDLDESTQEFLDNMRRIEEIYESTRSKALAMLKTEGLSAEPEDYPTTGDKVILLGNNPYVGDGTYLPKEYIGTQAEYQGVMVLRPYGLSAMANFDLGNNCLIIDGDPKTEPLVRYCH